jgi:alpha-galactosidase
MRIIAFAALLFLSLSCFSQGNKVNNDSLKFEGLALTPPMGWNSWNKFACDVNEKLIRETADAMVATGLKDAGYIYINIDDCWHGQRDSLGFIHPDPDRFPSGMKALADYIHSKGLKFGVYSDAGWETCGGRPGSRGFEYQDALTYARWGVDYLKYDWCNTAGLNAEGAYMTIGAALRNAGRPVVLSICEWGNDEPWKWGPKVGHLWRTTGDIYNCFDCIKDHGTWQSLGVLQIFDKQGGLREYAGPGHWNDPDMMEVGNGMAVNEDRAHFTMWSMLAAPLIAGNDLRNMSKETIEILSNKEVIAVNQDKLGIQGFKYSENNGMETWFKPLTGGDWAVMFLNRKGTAQEIKFNWAENDVKDEIFEKAANFSSTNYKIRDLWTKKDAGTTKKVYQGEVSGHDVVMLRLSKN